MGQHVSTESRSSRLQTEYVRPVIHNNDSHNNINNNINNDNNNNNGNRDTGPGSGSRGDHRHAISEDETMVDVSSASSVLSSRTRTSSSQRGYISRIIPNRTPPSLNPGTRQSNRRSSLWCRVQSLRNRIYRTSRSVHVVDSSDYDNTPPQSRIPTSPS